MYHFQVVMKWQRKQLQSQSEITPPQIFALEYPGLCVQTDGDNDWWLPRWPQPQPQPSPSQPPRLTDRDFLLRWEPSRHSPAIKGPPSVTEADLQQELIHTVSYVCFPSLPPPRTYINSLQTLYKWETLTFYPYKTLASESLPSTHRPKANTNPLHRRTFTHQLNLILPLLKGMISFCSMLKNNFSC